LCIFRSAAAAGLPLAIALAWFLEVGQDGVHLDTSAVGVARPSARGLRHYADAIVIGVLLIAVVVLLVRQSDIGRPPPPANPAIAVLPFENLSGDPKQEYFSDGLAEEMLDRLSRVPGLKVIASSSSFSYKGRSTDAKTVAAQLGVTTVLEGSVRRDGRKLKINAKLIDGATGFQLWSGSFDRDVTDIFAVQAELAKAVIDAIVPAARGDVVDARAPTSDINAHDHYLLGIAAQRSRTTARLADSVNHLEQAVTLDPTYAEAQAALARSLLLWSTYGGLPDPDNRGDPLRRAEQAVYKALSLDASSSDAHGALGNLLRTREQYGAAEEEYKRALKLNSNNSIAVHDYGVLLSMMPGREAELAAIGDRALELDPRSAIDWTNKLSRILETQGIAAYRKQFALAMQVFAGDADGLATLSLAASTEAGYPFEAYELSHALERAGGDRASVLLATLEPLLAVGDYDECLARIDRIRATGEVAPLETAPVEVRASGLKGDYKRLNAVLTMPDRSQISPHFRYVVDAYWLVVQGRIEDAAAALAKAGDFEKFDGGFMGTSISTGALPAIMRIYQADGREHEAQSLLARSQERLRKQISKHPPTAAENVLLANLAIAAGQRVQAVRHLQQAMKQVPIPDRFYPELPWFKSLEGEPGYAEVVQELHERRAALRAEMAKLDAAPKPNG